MLKGKRFFLPLGLLILVLSSCNKGVLYQKYVNIPDQQWDMKSPVTFKMNIDDTVNYYNIYVNVRNADSYAYSNLYLFIDIASPGKVTERDTLQCILADPNTGKWLGEGLGDIWDNKIPFKFNVRFPHKGEYSFTYTQAMRDDKLTMIMDAGITVEQTRAPVKSSN
jgi:gliding motility-associated lipoprotein GldH